MATVSNGSNGCHQYDSITNFHSNFLFFKTYIVFDFAFFRKTAMSFFVYSKFSNLNLNDYNRISSI